MVVKGRALVVVLHKSIFIIPNRGRRTNEETAGPRTARLIDAVAFGAKPVHQCLGLN